MTSPNFDLGRDFAPVSYEAWREQALRDLKGAPFEKLASTTADGLKAAPLYTADAGSAEPDASGFPGRPPFSRSAHVAGQMMDGWDIRQEYEALNPTALNAAILADLEGGARSAMIRLAPISSAAAGGDSAPSRGGAQIGELADLARALRGVRLDMATVALDAGGAFLPAGMALAALIDQTGVDRADALAALNADPLGALARDGALPCALDGALRHAAALAAWTAVNLPKSTALAVDASPYHDAGATPLQELAIALSSAAAYLRAMTAAGLSIDAAARQIVFTLSVGSRFFEEIAKLRAARKLWARVVEACGGGRQAQAMRLVARVSRRTAAKRDPWVNMLRNTVSCFAAGVAGSDAVIALPFDAALGQVNAFGRRVARNAQIILQEEAHIHRVIDPAGGGWHLESLTDQMAERAWRLFQELEGQGGVPALLCNGALATRIEAAYRERAAKIAARKLPLIGVSEFPNLEEDPVVREPPEHKAPDPAPPDPAMQQAFSGPLETLCEAVLETARANASFTAMVGALTDDAPARAQPLPTRPDAEPFERLRDAADAHAARSGARPRAFLANLGPIADHTARAAFAKYLLAAGGIAAIDNDGFDDPEQAAAAFAESGAKLAVICGADTGYQRMAAPTAAALKRRGAAAVVLAGRPGSKEPAWREAGVDRFIYMKCDAIAVLTQLLRDEGVLL